MRFSLITAAVFCLNFVLFASNSNAESLSPARDAIIANLPGNGDYKGVDESGQPCWLYVHHFLVPTVVEVYRLSQYNERFVLGAFSFSWMNDEVKNLENTDKSFRILSTRNSAKENEPANRIYFSLNVEKTSSSIKKYSVGVDDSKIDSPVVSCSISGQ